MLKPDVLGYCRVRNAAKLASRAVALELALENQLARCVFCFKMQNVRAIAVRRAKVAARVGTLKTQGIVPSVCL